MGTVYILYLPLKELELEMVWVSTIHKHYKHLLCDNLFVEKIKAKLSDGGWLRGSGPPFKSGISLSKKWDMCSS